MLQTVEGKLSRAKQICEKRKLREKRSTQTPVKYNLGIEKLSLYPSG